MGPPLPIVRVRTIPANATIHIDKKRRDQPDFPLALGTHRLTVSAPGFETIDKDDDGAREVGHQKQRAVDWQFTIEKAGRKLKRLYPEI